MIRVKNLVKTLGEATVLNGIDFETYPGEFLVIIGASGSGKTTLFRCLSMKENWDQGSYIYKNIDLMKQHPLKKWQITRDWAYLHEKPQLQVNRTAFKNIIASRFKFIPFWRKLIGKPGTDEHVFAMDYLEKMGLMDHANLKVEKLSGGEKQRIAIAKAMVQGAKVIFADEPISGLDPHASEQIMADLKHLCKTEHIMVLCIMHQVELAEKFADRILGMANGQIVVDVRGRRLTQAEKMKVFQ